MWAGTEGRRIDPDPDLKRGAAARAAGDAGCPECGAQLQLEEIGEPDQLYFECVNERFDHIEQRHNHRWWQSDRLPVIDKVEA